MNNKEQIVRDVLESEAFVAGVNGIVETQFDRLMDMITFPFMVVTVPLTVIAVGLIVYIFTKQGNAVEHLAQEIKNLAISLAHLEGQK